MLKLPTLPALSQPRDWAAFGGACGMVLEFFWHAVRASDAARLTLTTPCRNSAVLSEVGVEVRFMRSGAKRIMYKHKTVIAEIGVCRYVFRFCLF